MPADVKTDVIGLNIKTVSGNRPMQYAIHIHDHENMQTNFETAVALEPAVPAAGRGGQILMSASTRTTIPFA